MILKKIHCVYKIKKKATSLIILMIKLMMMKQIKNLQNKINEISENVEQEIDLREKC